MNWTGLAIRPSLFLSSLFLPIYLDQESIRISFIRQIVIQITFNHVLHNDSKESERHFAGKKVDRLGFEPRTPTMPKWY